MPERDVGLTKWRGKFHQRLWPGPEPGEATFRFSGPMDLPFSCFQDKFIRTAQLERKHKKKHVETRFRLRHLHLATSVTILLQLFFANCKYGSDRFSKLVLWYSKLGKDPIRTCSLPPPSGFHGFNHFDFGYGNIGHQQWRPAHVECNGSVVHVVPTARPGNQLQEFQPIDLIQQYSHQTC